MQLQGELNLEWYDFLESLDEFPALFLYSLNIGLTYRNLKIKLRPIVTHRKYSFGENALRHIVYVCIFLFLPSQQTEAAARNITFLICSTSASFWKSCRKFYLTFRDINPELVCNKKRKYYKPYHLMISGWANSCKY